MSRYFLCVDVRVMLDPTPTTPYPLLTDVKSSRLQQAGGTKTAAAIANSSGKVVARGKGRSANMAEVGFPIQRLPYLTSGFDTDGQATPSRLAWTGLLPSKIDSCYDVVDPTC